MLAPRRARSVYAVPRASGQGGVVVSNVFGALETQQNVAASIFLSARPVFVKPLSHGGNTGSNPVGDANNLNTLRD